MLNIFKYTSFVLLITLVSCSDQNNFIESKISKYKMDVCGDEVIKNPDHNKISAALLKITSNSCGRNSFLIIELSSNKNIYVQTEYVKEENNFILEYQDGSLDKHFKSVVNLNNIEILNALVGYASTSNLWDQNVEWKRIQIH